MTRKIRANRITDKILVNKLEKIGSNCLNLLLGPAKCDLKERDFSYCAIPYSYLYKRDLSGCNFSHANMDGCFVKYTRLDNSKFIQTRLTNMDYDYFIYFKGYC